MDEADNLLLYNCSPKGAGFLEMLGALSGGRRGGGLHNRSGGHHQAGLERQVHIHARSHSAMDPLGQRDALEGVDERILPTWP